MGLLNEQHKKTLAEIQQGGASQQIEGTEGKTVKDYGYVQPFGSTPDVLSSDDLQGQFKADSAMLDQKSTMPPASVQVVRDMDNGDGTRSVTYSDGGTATVSTSQNKDGSENYKETGGGSGGALWDEMEKSRAAGEAKIKQDTQRQMNEVKSLLPTTLKALDQQYAASVSNIESTYTKLIDEQSRINKQNVARVKAYGLGTSAMYNPVEFSDAVSNRERTAANEINKLENERNALIASAKSARDQGKAKALKESMESLFKVEETMRQRTKELADEVQKRYELAVQMRKDLEAKHQESVKKMLTGAKVKYLQKFRDAKSEEEKDKVIREIILNSGGTLGSDDYYSVYSELAAGASEAEDAELKQEKAKLDIENTKNTIKNRDLSTQNANANRNAQTKLAQDKEARLAQEEKKGTKGDTFGAINQLLDMEDEDGTAYTDDNGFITPKGFNKLIASAKEDGISRKEFLDEYGHLLYEGDEGDYAYYGLTKAEINNLLGN
jgi:hypothetical protein